MVSHDITRRCCSLCGTVRIQLKELESHLEMERRKALNFEKKLGEKKQEISALQSKLNSSDHSNKRRKQSQTEGPRVCGLGFDTRIFYASLEKKC